MESKIQDDFSLDFLKSEEGYKEEAYIPKQSNGKYFNGSGVTIAIGFDLGQQSLKGLNNMGLSSELIENLKIFLQRKYSDKDIEGSKQLLIDMEKFNKENKFTKQDWNFIGYSIPNFYFEELNRIYFNNNLHTMSSYGIRTAILSIFYHYGNLNKTKWRKKILDTTLDKDLTIKEKEDIIIKILKNEDQDAFEDSEEKNYFLNFKSRRKREGEFIEKNHS